MSANVATSEEQTMLVTNVDLRRLRERLTAIRAGGDAKLAAYADELDTALSSASTCEPERVPNDVVTMHSVVRLRDQDSWYEAQYTLVYPEEADVAQNRVSVLSALGVVLFGSRAGGMIVVPEREGLRRYRVERIEYQPEAAGHYGV